MVHNPIMKGIEATIVPPKAAALVKVAGIRKNPPATSPLAYMIRVTGLKGKNRCTVKKYSAPAKPKATRFSRANPVENSIRSFPFILLPRISKGIKKMLPRSPTRETRIGWKGMATKRIGHPIRRTVHKRADSERLSPLAGDLPHRTER